MKKLALVIAFCATAELQAQSLPDVVMLDFTASYCQPCQQMVPVLQRMERDGFPIRRIDITEQPQVSRRYKVDRIPTLILMVEGKEAKRLVGLQAEAKLRRMMNDAAQTLDMKRRAAAGKTRTAEANTSAEPPKPKSEPAESPGLLARMKEGLFGGLAGRDRKKIDRPDVRAQSPEDSEALLGTSKDSKAMQATVRVRLDDGEFRDVGTGTIIQSSAGQSTILTCAHIFREMKDNANVVVELFRDGSVMKYTASLLGGDHNSDVAILQIQNRSPLPTVTLATALAPADANVFSIGCNAGNVPTIVNSKVVQVNRYEGPENIVCSIDPVQGRSGGGLFNSAGQLIGVCSGAFRDKKEGLYTGVGAVRKLLTRLKLNTMIEAVPPGLADAVADVRETVSEVPNPFAGTEDEFAALFTQDGSDLGSDGGLGSAAAADPADFAFDTDSSPAAADPVNPNSLPNPFSPGSGNADSLNARAATPASIGRVTGNGPPEITVIIGGRDSVDKKVVVIPKPSPWLLEILTGDSTVRPGLSASRSNEVSATSARQTAP